MSRSKQLSNAEFDILVVGAGIYGATLAHAAAQQGLSVALIDKGDFGSGASANSLKILHGGLRYLQSFDLVRMRQSIRARRTAFAHLPHLAKPASFLVPVGAGWKRSEWAYGLAAKLNDAISYDRNNGLPPSHQIGPTRVWSADELRQKCPALGTHYRAALNWQDGFIENTERFTLAYVRSAMDAGATACNYMQATGLLREGEKTIGVTARDEISGEDVEIRSRLTAVTAGTWISELTPTTPLSQGWVRAWNVVTPKQWFGPYGVGLDRMILTRDGYSSVRRNFFFAPWRGGTMIGTAYALTTPAADSDSLSDSEIDTFIADINQLYPAAELDRSDVSFAHIGLQPARLHRGTPIAEPDHRSRMIEQVDSGYVSMSGVKYTTALLCSEHLIRRVLEKWNKPYEPPQQELPLLGGRSSPSNSEVQTVALQKGIPLSDEMADELRTAYGALVDEVLALCEKRPELAQPLTEYQRLPRAAIAYAMQAEHAIHLDDILLRRTSIGTFTGPSENLIREVSRLAADIAEWDEAREQTERARVRDAYRRLGVHN